MTTHTDNEKDMAETIETQRLMIAMLDRRQRTLRSIIAQHVNRKHEYELTIAIMTEGLQAVADLMGESKGVAGLLQHGEIATWGWLLSERLEDFNEAMNKVIDMQAEEREREQEQHEIKMDEDKHYADDFRRRKREDDIAVNGIDE